MTETSIFAFRKKKEYCQAKQQKNLNMFAEIIIISVFIIITMEIIEKKKNPSSFKFNYTN